MYAFRPVLYYEYTCYLVCDIYGCSRCYGLTFALRFCLRWCSKRSINSTKLPGLIRTRYDTCRINSCRGKKDGKSCTVARCVGVCAHVLLGRSGMVVDPRIPTSPGRTATSGFHRPGMEERGGGYSFVSRLSHLTIDHACLSRRSTVLAPINNRDTFNNWALITLFPYITYKLFANRIPFLFWPPVATIYLLG